MRVFVSADMEGIAGVAAESQVDPHRPEYQENRRLLTREVNAAIEGALEAGVQEVIVNDGHWSGGNLLLDELHPAAEVVTGYPRPLAMCEGMGPGFDAAFLIGYHCSAGVQDAVMPHTYADPLVVREVLLDGRVQSEGSLNGYLCGYFGCPVALFTGDASAVSQMHEFCLEVEGVVVKEPIGETAARTLHPAVARERVRAGARRAIERLDGIPPLRPPSPVRLQVEFVRPGQADRCLGIPGVRRRDARSVEWEGGDYLDGYRLLLALVDLASASAG